MRKEAAADLKPGKLILRNTDEHANQILEELMTKRVLLVNILLIFVMAISACAPKAAPTQEPVPQAAAPAAAPAQPEPAKPTDAPAPVPPTEVPQPDPVTIQVWIYESFAKDDTAPIYAAVEKFQDTYPYITVELIPMQTGSGPYRDAYIAAAQGGGGPDALMVDIIWSPQLAAAELALNLDEFASGDIDNFYTGPVETVTYDGSIYGLPWYTNALAMFYNKTAFEAAGLPLPADGWTWADFKNAAIALTKGDMYGFGVMAGYGGTFEWFPWLWQNGGNVLEADNVTAAFTSPEGIEAAAFFLDLFKEGVVPEAAKSWKSWDELAIGFTSGTIAMYEVGDWGLAGVDSKEPTFEWGVAPLPMNKQKGTVVGGANWIVNPNTKSADAAYKWIEFVCGPESFELMDGYKRLSARSGGDQQIVKDDPRMQVFVDSLAFSRARTAIPNWTTVDYDCLQPAFLKVLLEGADVEAAMMEAGTCTNTALAQ
jgi:multiple sugar transport system substrate-binding protein